MKLNACPREDGGWGYIERGMNNEMRFKPNGKRKFTDEGFLKCRLLENFL